MKIKLLLKSFLYGPLLLIGGLGGFAGLVALIIKASDRFGADRTILVMMSVFAAIFVCMTWGAVYSDLKRREK